MTLIPSWILFLGSLFFLIFGSGDAIFWAIYLVLVAIFLKEKK